MRKNSEILIVGAGPSGLSAAIFLSEAGYHPRIIDKKPVISEYSKALGINPRTLEIFEQYNLVDRFLLSGRKMPAMNLWKGEKLMLRNEFAKAKHKYPFLIIQPQKQSEEMLLEELSNRKIQVEYSAQFESFVQNEKGYVTTIDKEDKESHFSDYIIGADGGHSMIRKQLDIKFEGLRYKETWELCDVELDMPVPKDEAHIRIFDSGGIIMIRIKDNLWRVAGNMKDILNHLPKNTTTGKIVWQSKFNISHNITQSLVRDNIVLIGDAAHLHSPLGGRGMNLGIEDAYIVSRLIKENRLSDYEKLRKQYLKKTVTRINDMTQFVAGHSALSRFMRKSVGLFRPFFPLAKPTARNFALGLDKHNKF